MKHFELVTVRIADGSGARGSRRTWHACGRCASTSAPIFLLAAVPNRLYLEAHGFGLERFIAHPLQIVDGLARAPDRPGHGVQFDWPALEALRA